MSSSEPPSRVPPRGPGHETKAARDELSSKGKVEKVREVDADEARKRKFRSFYDDDLDAKSNAETENRPSPFDLASGKEAKKPANGPLLGSTHSELGDVEEAIIPSPAYTPPPDLSTPANFSEDEEDGEGTGSLPRSEEFWHDVDFPPDQPAPAKTFHETTSDAKGMKAGESKKGEKKGGEEPFGRAPMKGEKKEEPSPFGPPGKLEKKGVQLRGREEKGVPPMKGKEAPQPEKRGAKEKEPSPFEIAASMKKSEKEFASEKERIETKGAKHKEKKEREELQSGMAIPMQREEREGGREGRKQGHEAKSSEITRTSLPPMPSYVEPMAAKAMTQAAPYIQPATAALFYQMVGTMYVMGGPQGVNRTEVVLNNAAFANSKFFGSTIKIEKYATAPDSFNITLSGSDQAVVSFRENIPSLMAAFQNGNFTFRVNRLDVEYRTEKPVFRRKESEERGDSGGGDLGERRK